MILPKPQSGKWGNSNFGCSIYGVNLRIAFLAAVIPCISFWANSQPPAQQPPQRPIQNPPQDAWTEHYRRATVSLGKISTIGNEKKFDVLGAGVLISPDSKHVILVTAKHVFNEPEQSWHPSQLRVRFSMQENKSFSEELGVPIQLTDQVGRNLWHALGDGSDIAAISLTSNFASNVTDAIGYQDFAQLEDVYDGASVFVFGYPGDARSLIGQEGLVRAVTRSGIIAWTDPSGVLEKPLLLDSNILPGNSGGPAFKVPSGLNKSGTFVVGNRTAFLGIVTADLRGYYSVQADGRVLQIKFPDLPLPSVEQVAVVGIGGLGKVEPASKVKELVDATLASITSPIAPQVR